MVEMNIVRSAGFESEENLASRRYHRIDE